MYSFLWLRTSSCRQLECLKCKWNCSWMHQNKIFDSIWFCQILLTDERMNCYCCLSKMNETFSSLYRKSFSFIYLLILIFWFIEIHLRIEIFVCHEDFFFWSSHLRSSLSLRSDLMLRFLRLLQCEYEYIRIDQQIDRWFCNHRFYSSI
jgi:hypothetical protein